MPASPPRQVRTELPGPLVREALARGGFDMQSGYRALVFDDARSQGTSLVDLDGNVFLDLFANFALGALGYNHPALLDVARSPAFAHAVVNPTSTPFVTAPAWFDFLEGLRTRWAPRGMDHVYCVDGGGEGVESALKDAFVVHAERRRAAFGLPTNPLEQPEAQQRAWMENAGTDAVAISFSGAFHGRGLGPMSATHSKVVHKADLPAFPWPSVPFPANRWPLERHAEENAKAEQAALGALANALEHHAGRVAAVIVEPVQSEGGDRHASPAFFRGVQTLAGQAGAAFVLDEVQTGVGISGTLWCHEQFDLPEPPDMMCFGKKMQMGGFFAREAWTVRQFGRMYQTRNGDRARAMLATATLRAIDAEGLLANVRETGAYFLERLQDLTARHRLATEARGRGFLLAFDLPDAATRDDFLKRTMRRGVFASYTGTRSVRLRPHLICTRAEVDEACEAFDATLGEMGG